MDPESRYETERSKWDAHAEAALPRLDDLPPTPLDATFGEYARGRLLLDGMADFLGDLEGRDVLEFGCGLGELTIVLARSGARLTTFDLSPASVEFTRRRAEREGVADRIRFVVAAGESLPFPDASFDVAVGKAVLHHLDPLAGAAELARVLRPNGRAAFSEPLGMNPLLVFARAHLPYPGKHDRGADRPLTAADLRAWQTPFRRLRMRPVQLFSMLERGLGFGRRLEPLRALDRLVLERWPRLGRFCRYGVLLFEMDEPAPSSGGSDTRERSPRASEEVVIEESPLDPTDSVGTVQASQP
jgi:SAM-dependent methyltransferase